MKKILVAAVLGLALVAAIGVGIWQLAGEEDEKTARGTCGGVTYDLSADSDDGLLEVTFEVRSSGPGEVWQIVVDQDGEALFEGQRTTDEEGEIDVEAIADDGATAFEATATPADGDACTATLTR